MVRRFFIFVAIISILGAGYFTYDKWVKDSNLTLWNFVPDNSVFVYESQKLKETLTHLNNQEFYESVNLLKDFNQIDESLTALDSMLEIEGGFMDTFKKTPFIVAGNITSKTRYGFLYLVELSSIGKQSAVTNIYERFLEAGWNVKTRKYLDFKITELIKQDGSTFTFLLYKNFFIGSFSAFLVEDAIRTFSSPEFDDFATTNPELYGIAKLEKDQGNLYVNMNRVADMVSAFTNEPVRQKFSKSSFLDVEIQDNTLELNGFVFPQQDDFLATFTEITGSEFDLSEIISNETSYLYHLSFTDNRAWQNAITKLLTPTQSNRKVNFIKEADFDVDYVYSLLEQEVAAGFYGEENTPFLMMEVKDAQEAFRFLKESSARYALAQGDTLYVEEYRNFEILRMPFYRFPGTFLGNIPGNYQNCFFTSYRNYILFAETLPVLKEMLIDISNENTWSKSIRKNRFLQKTNQEAVFSLFVDVPTAWDNIYLSLNPDWREFLSKNEYVLKNFQNIAIQFNPIDTKFYASVIVEQPQGSTVGDSKIEERQSISLGPGIRTKPYIVTNHNTRLYEVMVQDTTNTLFLIGSSFDPEWSMDLGEPIISDISQIDYYKNDKLQYVFITSNQIFILDRNGKNVEDFPKTFSQLDELQFLEIVDYGDNKDYRFSITDVQGQTILTDKNGNPLEGWDPMVFDSPLTAAMRHHRIGGTDVFVVSQQNGELKLLSRRGRNFPGFPIRLNEPVESDYFVEEGSDFSTTEITTVTSSGQLVSFDFKGNTTNRAQLLKPAAETEFQILKDVSGKNFLIQQTTEDQLSILSEDATRLFEKDYLNSQIPFVQYYRISASQQFVIVGEKKGEFIYIYDLNGRLITRRPILGNNPISMIYYERKGEYQLYIADGNELNLTAISN